MNRLQAAEQLRRALQMFSSSLTDEQAMEVVAIFNPWEIGKAYAVGDYITFGINAVGDPQLYKVIQNHTSQADWTPDATPALYDAIGLDETGYPVWSQPTGAHDAYNNGDVVNFNNVLYLSTIDGNVWSPDITPQYWKLFTDESQ